MANVATGETYRILIACVTPTQWGINRFDYTIDTILGGPATDQELVSGFRLAIRPLYLPLLSSAANFYGAKLFRVSPAPTSRPVTDVAVGPGTDGATLLPTQSTGLITKKQLRYGKGKSGRVYLPFPASSADVGGNPSAAYVANLLTLATYAFSTPVPVITGGGATVNMVPAIASGPVYPTDIDPIIGAIASIKWATQRRRGAYGKSNNGLPWV